jgi:hypothetical protein
LADTPTKASLGFEQHLYSVQILARSFDERPQVKDEYAMEGKVGQYFEWLNSAGKYRELK